MNTRIRRLLALSASVALSLTSSFLVAGDPHEAARESVICFHTAIRDGDADAFSSAVYKEKAASAQSMEYEAYRKAINIRSRVVSILDKPADEDVKLDLTEILRGMPVYYHILDSDFIRELESARVFVDDSGTAAVSELGYGGRWWFLETRRDGGHWQVVLNEKYDQMHNAAATLALVNIASSHVSAAEDALEHNQYARAVKELRSLTEAEGLKLQK